MRENINLNENLMIQKESNPKVNEHYGVKGYVTVIKNKGKSNEEILCKNKPNLLTNAGRDSIHAGMYTNAGASQTAFNYIGLSVNTATPAVADTTLVGEITTGGLTRVQASTRTHTNGTNTSSIEHQFTASAIHTAVQLSGIFSAVSTGTLGHENTFTPASLQSSDTLTITWVITAG